MRLAMKSLPERRLNKIELLEIEQLLPWYAVGALNARDTKSVEEALARDVRLAARFAEIEEEYAAIIDLNENLGAPSARVMQQLFASIDDERKRRPVSFGIALPAGALSSRVVA
jgi:anti-sigma factor RsiW